MHAGMVATIWRQDTGDIIKKINRHSVKKDGTFKIWKTHQISNSGKFVNNKDRIKVYKEMKTKLGISTLESIHSNVATEIYLKWRMTKREHAKLKNYSRVSHGTWRESNIVIQCDKKHMM